MRVVLGIGNPGREYEATRHNVGFRVIDELARRQGLGEWQRKWQAEVCEVRQGDLHVLLIKPRTYVNGSGASAQAVLAFYKAPPSDLLVVVDDINLPLGTLRLRGEGSAGGHNGLRDIEASLGKAYPRLRLGVGAPTSGAEQIGHVLSPFPPDQVADVELMIRKAADCVESWLRAGVVVACSFNGPLRPPPPKPKPVPPAEPPSGSAEVEPSP